MNEETLDLYQKIRPFVQKDILEMQTGHDDAGLYQVNSEYHTHNGIDSPLIDTLSGGNSTLAAGLTTEVQYNDGGSLGANSNLTFNNTSDVLRVSNVSLGANDGTKSFGFNSIQGVYVNTNNRGDLLVAAADMGSNHESVAGQLTLVGGDGGTAFGGEYGGNVVMLGGTAFSGFSGGGGIVIAGGEWQNGGGSNVTTHASAGGVTINGGDVTGGGSCDAHGGSVVIKGGTSGNFGNVNGGNIELRGGISGGAGVSNIYLYKDGNSLFGAKLDLTAIATSTKTYTFPNASGTIALSGSSGTVVNTFAKSGSTALTGDVTISGGSNVTLTQVGQNIQIAAASGGSAAGSSTQIQYNTSSAFDASANFTWDNSEKILLISGIGGSFSQGIQMGPTDSGSLYSISTIPPSVTDTQSDAIFITVANGAGTGNGGELRLTSGNSGATSGDGGTITITSGSNGGGTGNGGDIILNPGAGSGGTDGVIKFYSSAGSIGGSDYAIFDTSSVASSPKTYSFPNQSGIFSTVTSGSGVPGSTPAALGQIYIDTLNSKVYCSTGTSSSADWKILN